MPAADTSMMKTQLCRFHRKRRCQRGADCPFAHGIKEQQARPDLKKTKLCWAWQRNACRLTAAECAHAHGVEDLRRAGRPARVSPSGPASSGEVPPPSAATAGANAGSGTAQAAPPPIAAAPQPPPEPLKASWPPSPWVPTSAVAARPPGVPRQGPRRAAFPTLAAASGCVGEEVGLGCVPPQLPVLILTYDASTMGYFECSGTEQMEALLAQKDGASVAGNMLALSETPEGIPAGMSASLEPLLRKAMPDQYED
mmetsp:Transcript_65569/g.181779  ORF Transcript_65569/g.181779 Transcript_65569/m.181779 type:complete len:255 (-) Transcript_65569:69-833(-)